MAIEMYQGGLTPEQIEQLQAPLDASLIKQRPGGGGKQLAYLKGKTVIDAANHIFGFGKWGYKVLSRTFERTTDVDGNITAEFYTADIELHVVGCAFPFPGDGVGIVVPPRSGSFAESHEKARKEAVTDALKRALRHYGSQFGNDLYDEDAYVDAGDGVMVQVKAIKPGNKQPAKRTIDAAQTPKQLPQPQSAHPTSSINAPTPNQLRKRCVQLLGADKFDEVKMRVLKADIPDDNMTPEQCAQIKRSLDILEERRGNNKAS